jgi:RNA polymerase sigma-70 factor (ECF subfamily)
MTSFAQEVASAATRRERGMEAVIDAYQAPLLRYATRVLNNAALAQDVVQNVLVKLFRQWQPGMQPDDRLKNWLFRVTHNEAVDQIRGEARRRRLQAEQEVEVDCATGGVHTDPQPDERETVVLGCLDVLEPNQKQVVLLRLQQGMSYEEISSVTGQSVGYVGNLLHFAVKRLAAEVRRREEGKPQ